MAWLPWSVLAGIPVLIMSGVAPRADDLAAEAAVARPIAHILLRPVQRELLGPDPFVKYGAFGLDDVGIVSGVVGGILAGVAIDSAIMYKREHAAQQIALAARPIAADFNFRQAIRDGIAELDRDIDLDITEIHEQTYEGAGKATSHAIMRSTDADHVICFHATYFIAPAVDQLRLLMDVGYYTDLDAAHAARGSYKRKYEYLSPSRGNLLRPFHEGEKSALIESINNYFDEKTERYPHNRKAYDKDRKRAIRTLEEREVILPNMAVSEGWPGDSAEVELQVATDNIMELIRADLADPSAKLPDDTEYLEFAGLDLRGRPKVFKGHVIGSQGSNTVYRDPQGNVYSVPQH